MILACVLLEIEIMTTFSRFFIDLASKSSFCQSCSNNFWTDKMRSVICERNYSPANLHTDEGLCIF